MKFETVLRTGEDGLWSRYKADVAIQRLEARYTAKDRHFGELKVHFDVATWDVNTHGYIYTDEQFLKELRAVLVFRGFSLEAAHAVDYSEQGMQKDSWVSCDIKEPFLTEYLKHSDACRQELESSWYANWGNLSFLDKL